MNYQSKCGAIKSPTVTSKPCCSVPSRTISPSQIPIKKVGCCSRPANSQAVASSKTNPSNNTTISSVSAKYKNTLLPIKSTSPLRIISGNRPVSRSSTNLSVPSSLSTSSSTAKSAPDLRNLASCSSKIKSTTFRRTGYQIGGKSSSNSNASSGCKCPSNPSVPVPKIKIKRL